MRGPEPTAQSRRRIMHAAMELTFEKMSLEIVLDDVAQRAEVSVQTIPCHFGSRDGLFDALEELPGEGPHRTAVARLGARIRELDGAVRARTS